VLNFSRAARIRIQTTSLMEQEGMQPKKTEILFYIKLIFDVRFAATKILKKIKKIILAFAMVVGYKQ